MGRKSFSVWNDARKTFVSESVLRHVYKLRPLKSALIDPIGWWKYAFEATIVMSRASSSSVSDNDYEEEKGMEDQKETWNDTNVHCLGAGFIVVSRWLLGSGLLFGIDGSKRSHFGQRKWFYFEIYFDFTG